MSLKRLNETFSKKGKKGFLACSMLEWYVNEMLTRVVLRRIRNVNLFKGLRTSRFRNAFKCSKKVSYVWHMHALYEWVMFAKKETNTWNFKACKCKEYAISKCASIIVRSMCSSKQVVMLFPWYIMWWLLEVHIEHISDSASHVLFRVTWYVSKSLICHLYWN